MKLILLSTLCVGMVYGSHWPIDPKTGEQGVGGAPSTFDCNMRKLAYKYGKQLIPRMDKFESLWYALDLNDPSCTVEMTSSPVEEKGKPEKEEAATGAAFYVHPHGDDSNDGLTVKTPVQSIQLAADRAAASADIKTVLLRGGVHYLPSTLTLEARHSNIHIKNYPGEAPEVSGGAELNVTWTAFKTSGTCGDKTDCNIWVADVGSQVADIPGLQVDGVRATRSRYPNVPGGIETSCGYGCMISANAGKWTPPNFNKYGPVDFYTDNITAHDRDVTADGWFKHYMIGVNGLCSVYDPPVSYWCSQHPSGGGAFAFRTPSGVQVSQGSGKTLPNAPYKNVQDAVFFVWRPARWANWMFSMDAKDYNAASGNFSFSYGGFQGARGSNSGGDFFVENVMEELDYPGEFFFDKTAAKLYLNHNGTGAPPSSASVVAPQKYTLVNMSGTQWAPVTNVKLTGITYKSTAYTYMKPHGVPSAGDWALDRWGAIFLQGTEGAVIDSCTFERLDGNGVMVSGYNRNATITHSDFSYIGGNAVAAWGYTNETTTDPGRPGVAIENSPEAGVDGTDGEHPRYTTVTSCTAREVGLYEKQSSFFVQAKTAQSIITGNVFFNGPRAGINANDGFGGGDEIGHNLVFSTCRESGDHGPFNSWDRQPFLTTVRTGKPDMIMQWREIHHNFFIDNYSPQENVDNDDGSAYYHTHDNFFVYGGNGMKNDFGGHDNYHRDNVYAYVGEAIGFYDAPMLAGHEDVFTGNQVVMTGKSVGNFNCGGTGDPKLSNNTYYTPDGTVTECGKTLAKAGDAGSTSSKTPDDATLLGWAAAKLGIQM